jgi:alpha-galactosidase
LANTGTTNTSILKNVQGLNTTWNRATGSEYVLQGIAGDNFSANSFQPYTNVLGANTTTSFSASGGRPTEGTFPYYNLSMPGGGVSLAVGWPGQWATSFTRNSSTGLTVTAGQQTTNISLKPGEEIRTPSISMCSWNGTDTVRAQNLWRQWMRKYSEPGATGQPMSPMTAQCTTGFYPNLQSTAAGEIGYAKKFVDGGAKPDYWWIDAGWYPDNGYWSNTGTWTPDPTRYPKGVKEVSDYVHSQGMKMVLWFEPERTTEGTWLYENHPEWLLGDGSTKLLNLGNPEARAWLIDNVSNLISSQGVDLYRQDFNMGPLESWQSADATNRRGMTENAHVQGYLAYLDALREKFPNMPMDTCASGGRRMDLETLRRAVPLLRSDYQYCEPYSTMATAAGMQCQMYGLASWIPYFGTGVIADDEYMIRSSACAALNIGITEEELNSADGPDWNNYKRLLANQRKMAPYFLGDYYPLTEYSQSEDVWMAWQFDRSDLGGGMVQAFRRANSAEDSMTFHLSGLDPMLMYIITNLDTNLSITMLGSQLMDSGLLCEINATSGSAVMMYQVVPEPSTIVMTCIGFVGLLAWARRKQRRERKKGNSLNGI